MPQGLEERAEGRVEGILLPSHEVNRPSGMRTGTIRVDKVTVNPRLDAEDLRP